VNDDELWSNITLRFFPVSDDQAIVNLMFTTPLPPVYTLERLELALFQFLVPSDSNDKLCCFLRFDRFRSLSECFASTAIEHSESSDERTFSRRSVGSKSSVFRIGEESDRGDIVGCRPARFERVGSFVASSSKEFRDTVNDRERRNQLSRSKCSGDDEGFSLFHSERYMLVVVPFYQNRCCIRQLSF